MEYAEFTVICHECGSTTTYFRTETRKISPYGDIELKAIDFDEDEKILNIKCKMCRKEITIELD